MLRLLGNEHTQATPAAVFGMSVIILEYNLGGQLSLKNST
jgi:hypothetical protein